MFRQPVPVFLDDRADDAGMVTPEYAVGMIVSVSLAMVLFLVVRSEPVQQWFSDLVEHALTEPG